MINLSDKDIILKIKNGEIDYFEIIIKKYASKIYQLIKKKVPTQEDIEDLVQNTFINFYKAVNRFNENLPIFPYLCQIAKNEVKMFYRSKKDFLPLKDWLKIDNSNFFKKDFNKEDYLKDLKKEEREIILMLADGFSYKEIARKFNKPLNTVRTIIRRTRLKINKLII